VARGVFLDYDTCTTLGPVIGEKEPVQTPQHGIIDIHTHPQWDEPFEQMARTLELARGLGIVRQVVLGGNLGFGYQPTADQVTQINDLTLRLVERWPDELIGFARLNAGLDDSVVDGEIDRCVKSGPLQGIKLAVWPNARSPELDGVMHRAEELGVPVLHHCWYKTTCKYEGESDYTDLAHLAARFPNVTIIAAHLTAAGMRGVQDIRPFPNLYIDTSGSQCSSGIVEYALSVLGEDRILYGSDIPGRDFSVQLGRIYGARMTPDQREKLLLRNAERLLGLITDEERPNAETTTGSMSADLSTGRERTFIDLRKLPSPKLVDVNTSLGRWPFATYEQDTAAKLSNHLAGEGIGLALVSSIDTALFPDPHIPNMGLAEALEPYPDLLPLMTLDPTLTHWRDCLETYRDRGTLNAVRVIPNYHRYTLDDPRMDELTVQLQQSDHPVLVVQMRLEDERAHYPLMAVPGVPVADIVALAERHPQLPILCLCAYRAEAVKLTRNAANILVDLAYIEFKDTLAVLLRDIPPDRVVFGSNTPMLYARAALMKMLHANVDQTTLEAVGSTNASRLLGIDGREGVVSSG
jgi:uncharacterized protein